MFSQPCRSQIHRQSPDCDQPDTEGEPEEVLQGERDQTHSAPQKPASMCGADVSGFNAFRFDHLPTGTLCGQIGKMPMQKLKVE